MLLLHDSFLYDGCVILDACSLLNLYASHRITDILPCVAERTIVADYILDKEALFIWERDREGRHRIPVDFSPVVEAQILNVVSVESEEEEDLYIRLAAAIGDDGESITAALAISRQWGMGTDDKGAMQIIRQNAPQVGLLTTHDIIRHWADVARPTDHELRDAITSIRQGATFTCPKAHPFAESWHRFEQ